MIQFKHFICDWIAQNKNQVMNKGKYGNLVGISHSMDHMLGMMLVLLPLLFFTHPLALILIALADGVIHYHIDYFKMKYSSKYTPSDEEFWWLMGIDQFLHQWTNIMILGVIFAII
jgi:hypothetical protein